MKPKLSLARKRALRHLHGGREAKTRSHLDEALNRMQAGVPQRLPVPFRWTKANLAREADVHITTILFKEEDGSYRYSAILERFELLKISRQAKSVRSNVDPVAETSNEAAEMEQELARQAGLICELRSKVRDLESREADVHDLMEKNAVLREECRRLQAELRRPA